MKAIAFLSWFFVGQITSETWANSVVPSQTFIARPYTDKADETCRTCTSPRVLLRQLSAQEISQCQRDRQDLLNQAFAWANLLCNKTGGRPGVKFGATRCTDEGAAITFKGYLVQFDVEKSEPRLLRQYSQVNATCVNQQSIVKVLVQTPVLAQK